MSADLVDAELIDNGDTKILNGLLGVTFAVAILFLILAANFSDVLLENDDENSAQLSPGDQVEIVFGEPIYMPRHEECIDPNNGQDADYIGYGVGYEPSLSVDSNGNMQITAHKDLRWGGEGNPFAPVLGGNLDSWYACEEGRMTTWDYWASWFWVSVDNGTTWGHGDSFDPTPGNLANSAVGSVTGGGSECLGDEGDIAIDANDVVYYLDTTLEDNWWHRFTEGGSSYEMGQVCQRMNTMAADDRPWVAAQGDGIIHYLGNSGASPPECTGDFGRYWYYHSENGGNTFSQCFAMPGGWSTISSQNDGPYVFVAQEDQDTSSGSVHIRISDDYGRGTGPGPSDGSWALPVNIGPRNGNCPEGYPVVNNNEAGTVAVVWADCPQGDVGAWDMLMAISYDNGTSWEEAWSIAPNWGDSGGLTMYPFVSISENNMVSVAWYGLQYGEDGYTTGDEWYLYAGAVFEPHSGNPFEWSIADPTPLHIVTEYEESNQDVHALHDFFETVHAPDGSWVGIAYQQNIGLHPFEANEEQRYIKFVRGEVISHIPEPSLSLPEETVFGTIWIASDI
ncbi:MAG: hypothetical protein QGI21_02410 [Candidatus Poseidoniaceae archaeon]|nr:hypothetical protein [Candidatus Poseidoniaceae archaeon]